MELGTNLKQLRKERNLTQEDLAEWAFHQHVVRNRVNTGVDGMAHMNLHLVCTLKTGLKTLKK